MTSSAVFFSDGRILQTVVSVARTFAAKPCEIDADGVFAVVRQAVDRAAQRPFLTLIDIKDSRHVLPVLHVVVDDFLLRKPLEHGALLPVPRQRLRKRLERRLFRIDDADGVLLAETRLPRREIDAVAQQQLVGRIELEFVKIAEEIMILIVRRHRPDGNLFFYEFFRCHDFFSHLKASPFGRGAATRRRGIKPRPLGEVPQRGGEG